ncbi:hypothetical protein Syun_024985 [Stephania yunnanensis]|uniref:Uncharacterized protein n=1 Tax=Stephania yunnanensis TaxID=152371 RepID=A0AAP0ETD4_9MAGN
MPPSFTTSPYPHHTSSHRRPLILHYRCQQLFIPRFLSRYGRTRSNMSSNEGKAVMEEGGVVMMAAARWRVETGGERGYEGKAVDEGEGRDDGDCWNTRFDRDDGEESGGGDDDRLWWR